MIFIFGLITDLGDVTYNYIVMGIGGSMITFFVCCLLYLTRRVYCCCCYKSEHGLNKSKPNSNKSQQQPPVPPAFLKMKHLIKLDITKTNIHRIYGNNADTEP